MRILSLFLFTLLFIQSTQAQGPLRFQNEVEFINSKDYLIDADKEVLVFTGSSSIRMWTDIQNVYTSVNAINTGFGGSEFSDLIYYREELIFAFNPDKIFIYEGDNDVNSGKEPESIQDDARILITHIREKLGEVPVYLISPKPSISRWHLKAEYEETNALLESLADDMDNVTYIDVWNPMLGEDGKPLDDIFIQDDLHMNEKGYQIWAKVIRPYVTD